MPTIAEEKDVWILAKRANLILGFPERYTRIANVLNAAGIRTKKLPRTYPRYYLPDIERLRDRSVAQEGQTESQPDQAAPASLDVQQREDARRKEKRTAEGSLTGTSAARPKQQH